jgi:hypothetical protein
MLNHDCLYYKYSCKWGSVSSSVIFNPYVSFMSVKIPSCTYSHHYACFFRDVRKKHHND